MFFALHQISDYVRHREQYPVDRERPVRLAAGFLKACLRWQLAARLAPVLRWKRPERLTVVLLSFGRVRNMEPQVRALLPLSCVGKIVVSNNNPAYRIADWVRVRDPRLVLLDQPRERFCGVRYLIAREEPGPWFLAIDDDVFLRPGQVQALFERLLRAPESPHGVWGHDFWDQPERVWGPIVNRRDQPLDVLHQVYAFTHDHVKEIFSLAKEVGEEVEDCIGDDILLSRSGTALARCHDVGPILHCLSARRVGTAIYLTRDQFWERRTRLFRDLHVVKPGLASADGRAD